MTIKRALISVSDKTNLVPFVKELTELGVEVISTGGTKKLLQENGVDVIGISEVTGFPEIMDGRLKPYTRIFTAAFWRFAAMKSIWRRSMNTDSAD